MGNSRVHVFALIWLFGCVAAVAACQSPKSEPAPEPKDKTQSIKERPVVPVPAKADSIPKQQFTDSGARIFYDRYPPETDNAYVGLGDKIEAAIVQITLAPTLNGKPAPEFLTAISSVSHYDLMGSDYVGSTDMNPLGQGAYRSETRARPERESGWRVGLRFLGQRMFVRAPDLKPNKEGTIDFGTIEVRVEDFLAGHTLARGRLDRPLLKQYGPAAPEEWSFDLHVPRAHLPARDAALAATPDENGDFIVAIPHRDFFNPEASPPLLAKEIQNLRLTNDFGCEWRVVGEREGFLELGTQSIEHGVLDCVVEIVLPEGIRFEDQEGEIPLRLKPEEFMDAVGKAWLHISRLDRQNHGYTIRYRGNGRFGVAAYLPNGAYLPKWTFADSTFLAERLLNVSKGQVTNFHVQADLTEKKFIRVLDAGGVPVRSFYYSFSNESRAFLSFTSFKDGKFPDVQYGALKIVPRSITRDLVVATSELKATWVKMDPQEGFVRVQLRDLWSAQKHRGIDYRAMVRIDTDGFQITEGTRVEIYSEEHRGLRAELTFEKGKFPLHQYDMSNFPIREPTEITLVLRAHPKWGFKEQAISDAVSATLSVKSKEIVLKLNQGQVVPQPRDGKYFVRAFFEGRPINLRWLGLSAEGKTCGADAYYKTVKGFEFYLRDSLFKEGSSRVKQVKPGHTELHIDGWSPMPLSASILSRYSNLKVRSRWFEIPAEEGRAPLFPAMRGDAGRQHLTLLGTAMGTELKLLSGWIGPNEVLNLDYNPTPVIYPEVADDWMLVAATSGERVYRDDTLRPGTYAWVYERYEREVYRSPEFKVPDQSAFFRLPKPDLPASALAGRVRFRIDADTLKSWIRDEVRVALVRENTARHLLGPFLSSSSDGRGFANMRMVGDEIEVYGLPTDGSLCLFFYSYDTDSASEEVEVEFDANKEMYGGGAPPLRRYMRPSSFPYVPSDKQETLRKLYEYDKLIVFELHTKGKRVQFERNLFLGQEYELHLFRKDAAEDATPLVIKFTPRLKGDSHGAEMGWEANAITKVQPLLRGLPSNFSLRDD